MTRPFRSPSFAPAEGGPGAAGAPPAAASHGAAPGAPAPDPSAPPPGARLMNVLRWALFVVLVVVAAVAIWSAVGPKPGGKPAATASAGEVWLCPMHPQIVQDRPGECPICGMNLEKRAAPSAATTYLCPMHPQIVQDRPGECPICGMDLVPKEAGAGASSHAGDVPGLTTIHVSPERVQLIGVRTAVAARRPLGGERELVGFIAPDEGRLARVQLRVAGWVQSLAVSREGERVAAGQPLLTLYSPELFQSEQEFLIELGAGAAPGAPGGMDHEAGALAAARRRLQLLGLPEDEIARLERTREASTRVAIRAPVAGTVLERGVVEGQYVGPDTPLLTLADLTRVWVVADLYEQDLAHVRAGDRVRFVTDALPGRRWEGRIEFVYPTVSTESRTVRARLTLDNRDGLLRPGMYGRVYVAGGGAPTTVVPSEAVIRTGEVDYVFLARADGHFEPRRVTLGRSADDWLEILSGLAPGDTVVASASFLIDSESRLEAAIAGMSAAPSGGHGGH
uniref:Efflux RND transporter periplasmic adaptor subunit n=1 Tax=Eiseniibacteriota bacterium TaxID=2212470 RepID=A0A832I567_UNCEI